MQEPEGNELLRGISRAGHLMIVGGRIGGVMAALALVFSLVIGLPMAAFGAPDVTFRLLLIPYLVLAVLWLVLCRVCVAAGQGLIERRESARRRAVTILYLILYWFILLTVGVGLAIVLYGNTAPGRPPHFDWGAATETLPGLTFAAGVVYLLWRVIKWMTSPPVKGACH